MPYFISFIYCAASCTCWIYFPGLKRVMGEIVKTKRPEYIAQEIAMKVHYYNIMRSIT